MSATRRTLMAERGKGGVGLTLGGALVIAGILIVILWSFWIGLVVALVGLVAFGGFARGRWY
jgi:CHASE2 domain-containing sensor protein